MPDLSLYTKIIFIIIYANTSMASPRATLMSQHDPIPNRIEPRLPIHEIHDLDVKRGRLMLNVDQPHTIEE